MRLLNQRLQPRIKHMCVDLRGADVRVAEQLLEAAQIGAVRQQVAGERMPQHMGRDGSLRCRRWRLALSASDRSGRVSGGLAAIATGTATAKLPTLAFGRHEMLADGKIAGKRVERVR